MTSHKTSVVYTKKCLLLPKSPGVPADLDQPHSWPWLGPSSSAASCVLRGQCQPFCGAGCSSSSMSAGACSQGHSRVPQRQKGVRALQGCGSGDWPCRLPSYSLSRHVVERSANVATEASSKTRGGVGWAETRHHFCNPPTREGWQLASCLMATGWRQKPSQCLPVSSASAIFSPDSY